MWLTRVPRRITVLIVLLAGAGCGDDSTGPDNSSPNDPGAQPGAAAVIVTPGDAQLAIGQTTTLMAEVRDSSDAVIEDAVVEWSSGDPNAATVNAAGVVTALLEGSVTITASSGSVSGEAHITVNIVTVCECAVIIDSTNLHLVARDSASGRFEFELIDGEMPEIDTASVIVGAQDEGFLRHVRGVERDGNTLILQTTQAGLANVIENGSFGGSTRIFAEGEVDSEATRDGSVWWGEATTLYLAEGVSEAQPGALGVKLNLSGLKLKLAGDTLPVDFEFEVEDGALNFGPVLDLGASIGLGGLQSFHAIYTTGLSLTAASAESEPLTYKIGIARDLLEKKAEKSLLIKRKPFIYWAGYVPIAGVLIFEVKAVATVSATGAINYQGQFGAGFELSAGVRYDDGNWSPVVGAQPRWDGRRPDPLQGLSAEVEAKVSFTVQPELFLKFYYVAGPFVNLQPTLEAPAKIGFPGLDWSVGLDYITKIALGGRAEILKKQPVEGVDPNDLSKLEFSATIPLHQPVILAEMYSRGPLVVTDNTSGDDLDDFYDVELTPAFNVNDALFGLRHDASTDTLPGSPVGERRVFTSLRSGDSYNHRVRLTDVAGNCTVQSQSDYDTVAVLSNLRIGTPGLADYDTARVAVPVECIPLGGVRVVTTTAGPDQDPDGYQLALTRIDTVGTSRKWFDDAGGGTSPSPVGGASVATGGARAAADLAIGTAGEVLVDSLIPKNPDPRSRATGEHRFALADVRENCAVAHPVSHDRVVLSGDTLFTNFDVQCIELGNVSVRTLTSDADPPPASEPVTYSARVLREGTPLDSVRVTLQASDDTTIVERIPLYSASGATGRHLVDLSVPDGLPDRCVVEGEFHRVVTVLSGETAEVSFGAECVERLHVRTETTGVGTDPDGYLVVVEPEKAPTDTLLRPIGTNETIGISSTTPGTTTIRLTDVSANCTVEADSVALDVSTSDSTLVTFAIDCPSAAVVRDSVVYAFEEVFIEMAPGRLEAVLGMFAVPQHVSEFGVEVSVDVLRDAAQPDEAFAIGTTEVSGPSFIGDGACPVVPDAGASGQRWVPVGIVPFSDGNHEFVARHGTEFECYDPVGDLMGANSVHFFGLKLVYWRTP